MNTYRKTQKWILCLIVVMLISIDNWAATAEPLPPVENNMMNSDAMLRWILVGVICLFVLIIAVLSNAIKVAGGTFQQKIKKERENNAKVLSLTLLFSLISSSIFAQASDKVVTTNSFDNFDIYLFVTIILLLFVVVLTLVRTLFVLMGIKKVERINEAGKTGNVKTWFQKFNETVPIEEEATLDMSHDYDGIRELDNKVPSWWTWTFLSSVVFAIIYLYRMFGSETLPNQYTELAEANEIAAIEKLAYLKKGANNVDENTVKLLGASDIGEGATLFSKNCLACHGALGQGGVGPNLTDDYWIHKGGIKDIFYTIKYGWAEKGMKSWKEDFSPIQMAQLASYVKSLHGTNPPGAKDKQGELFTEEAGTAPSDSTKKMAADSTALKNK